MKTLIPLLILLILFSLLYSLPAQIKDKINYQNYPDIGNNFSKPYKIPKHFNNKFSNTGLNRQTSKILSLTEPVHFPYQDVYGYYQEALPVFLANGQLLMVWVGADSLKCAHSSDGGLTWGVQVIITTGH